MALSDSERLAMIVSTHDMAREMIDDLNHMRETVAKPMPTSGDLRRISNLLRRMLIDNGGDLNKIAPPRLARRLHFLAPDMNSTVKEYGRTPCYFASIGVAGVFGMDICSFQFVTSRTRIPGPERWTTYGKRRATRTTEDGGTEYVPEPTLSLKLDSFLSQRVLYFNKRWINRGQVIKYVANIASGVHSGAHKNSIDLDLHHIRQIASLLNVEGEVGNMSMRIHRDPIVAGPMPVKGSRDGVDFVLAQLGAAAKFLTTSPDVIELEEMIKNEKIEPARQIA